MESKIKAVIFDMDGVLIDSEYFYLQHTKKLLKKFGKEVKEEDLYSIVGTPMQKTYEMVHKYVADTMSIQDVIDAYDKYWSTIEADYSQIINEGALETLQYLKQKGYHLAIASSNNIETIHLVLRQCQFKDYFEVVLSGDMFKMSKPNPEIYLTTAKLLQVNPHQCAVVEDSVYGIKAGKAAGMTVFALKERFKHDQSLADYHINLLPEIKKYL